MGNKLLLFLALIFSFSCAPKNNDNYVRCGVYIKFDEQSNRVNGFWDLDRKEEVSASDCDEILPTSR